MVPSERIPSAAGWAPDGLGCRLTGRELAHQRFPVLFDRVSDLGEKRCHGEVVLQRVDGDAQVREVLVEEGVLRDDAACARPASQGRGHVLEIERVWRAIGYAPQRASEEHFGTQPVG
jgi:hypothetical protein